MTEVEKEDQPRLLKNRCELAHSERTHTVTSSHFQGTILEAAFISQDFGILREIPQ